MTLRFIQIVAQILPITLLFSACKTFDEGADQTVLVQSYPAGATVKVDGEEMGRTPTELKLARKISHLVVLEKPGYKTTDVVVAPVKNEAGQGTVKFGLMDEMGYYFDLDPNPVQVQLIPDILPPSRGPDAYAEMTAIVADVDLKRKRGEIGPVEHKYMVEKIVEFYTQ